MPSHPPRRPPRSGHRAQWTALGFAVLAGLIPALFLGWWDWLWDKIKDPEPHGVTVHSEGIIGCTHYTDATPDEVKRHPQSAGRGEVAVYDGNGYPPELVLTLQTPTPKAVVITAVKIKALERTAVPDSGVIVGERACGGVMMTRPFDVDLSETPVRIQPKADGSGEVVDFPLKVSQADPEQLGLLLDPGDQRVRFTVEVEWVADGESRSTVLDNTGRGFEVMGTGDLPTHTLPAQE